MKGVYATNSFQSLSFLSKRPDAVVNELSITDESPPPLVQ
jgi:hypothetical protein